MVGRRGGTKLSEQILNTGKQLTFVGAQPTKKKRTLKVVN